MDWKTIEIHEYRISGGITRIHYSWIITKSSIIDFLPGYDIIPTHIIYGIILSGFYIIIV